MDMYPRFATVRVLYDDYYTCDMVARIYNGKPNFKLDIKIKNKNPNAFLTDYMAFRKQNIVNLLVPFWIRQCVKFVQHNKGVIYNMAELISEKTGLAIEEVSSTIKKKIVFDLILNNFSSILNTHKIAIICVEKGK